MPPTNLVDLSSGRSFVGGFPQEFFAWLRREHPVWWHPPTENTPDGAGFWVVSRHAEAVAIMRDPVTFSSGAGGTAIVDTPGAKVTLNQSDDPQHHRLRSLVNRGFTPTTIGRLEEDLRARAESIVDGVPRGEPFDFVSVVAQELPLQAICGVLGVSQSDRVDLARIVNAGLHAETGEVLGSAHVRELGEYAQALISHKRRHPADDIFTIVVHAGEDGSAEPLTDKELRAFFTLLFPAGAETTRGAIAGGVLALIEHPDQATRLRSDPALVKTAVEEIVRWTSPSAYKRRTATREVELAGTAIQPGDKVTYWEMSANRDESVFEDPFQFDVGRQPNPHVGFGLGSHFCLGASLARLELRLMLETLLARFDGFELAGTPTWPPNNRLVGMTHLPLVAHAAVSA
jgi:cytochrome P450